MPATARPTGESAVARLRRRATPSDGLLASRSRAPGVSGSIPRSLAPGSTRGLSAGSRWRHPASDPRPTPATSRWSIHASSPLGRFRLGDLRPSDVQNFVNDLAADGLSVSRIRKCRIVLALMLDAAVRDGIISRNVARGARLPRATRREAAYFEPEVVDSIVAALKTRIRCSSGCSDYSGFGTAKRSPWSVDRSTSCVVGCSSKRSVTEVGGQLAWGTPKSHAERQVPLPPSLAQALEQHLSIGVGPNGDALVFTSPSGGVIRLSNFNHRVWRPVLDRLGLPAVGVHVLRHSAAARMIAAGASPKAVQTVLGHANAGFTLSVYGHMFDADLDDLAQRLDEPRNASPRNFRACSRPALDRPPPQDARHRL